MAYHSQMGVDGYGDQLAEIEARIRMDLNSKLAAINQYLQEHTDTCEKIDLMRERSMRTVRNEFNTLEKELQVVYSLSLASAPSCHCS